MGDRIIFAILLFSVLGLLVPVSALEPGDEDIDLEVTQEELDQEQLEKDEWYAQQRYASEEYRQMVNDSYLKIIAEAERIEEQEQKFIDSLPEEVQFILFFVDLREVTKAIGIKVDSDSEGNNTPTPTTPTPTTPTPTTPTPTTPTPTTPTPTTPTPTTSKFYVPLGDFYESGGDNKYYWMDTTLPNGTPITILLNLPDVTANTILDSDIIEVIEVTETKVSSELVDPVDVISIHVPDMDPSPSTSQLGPERPFRSTGLFPPLSLGSQVGPERPIGNFVTDSNYDDGSNGAFDQELWNTLNDVPTHRWVLMNDLITSEYFWDGGPVTMSDPYIRNPGGYVMLDPSGNTIFKEQKVATMEEYMFQAQLNSKTYLDRMPRIISCNPDAPLSSAVLVTPEGETIGTCPTSSAGSFEVTPPIGTGPVSQPSRPNTAPSIPDAMAYHTYARIANPLTGGTPYGGFESAASQDAALQEAIAVSITNYPLSFR